jgi:DNA-binding response OmpR family regulator
MEPRPSTREDATISLLARIDELEEEVRQQKELLAPETQYSVDLGPTRRRLLTALHAARGVPRTRSWLLEAVWPGEDVCDTNVRMQVYALRKVLEPHGVRVLCRRPSLYLIDPETLPALDALRA